MLISSQWPEATPQFTGEVGTAALQTRIRWNETMSRRAGKPYGTIFAVTAPEQFSDHLCHVFKHEMTPDDFVVAALTHLEASFGEAKRLGAKMMEGDPVLMSRPVGDIFDALQLARRNGSPMATYVAALDGTRSMQVNRIADHMALPRADVIAIAAEFEAHLVLPQLVRRPDDLV